MAFIEHCQIALNIALGNGHDNKAQRQGFFQKRFGSIFAANEILSHCGCIVKDVPRILRRQKRRIAFIDTVSQKAIIDIRMAGDRFRYVSRFRNQDNIMPFRAKIGKKISIRFF